MALSSSLHEMKEWAIHIDKGLEEIDRFLSGRSYLVNDNENDHTKSMLEDILDDAKETKIMIQNDVSTLKAKSSELKILLQTAEAEKNKLKELLMEMGNVLCPGELNLDGSILEPSIINGSASSNELLLSTLPDSMSSSVASNANMIEESFVAVEVTPGMNTRVSKSQFADLANQNGLLVPPATLAEASPYTFFSRRAPLTYSPSPRAGTSTESSSFESCEPTPKRESLPVIYEGTTTMQKPKLPLMSSLFYELLGVKHPEAMKAEDTPPGEM